MRFLYVIDPLDTLNLDTETTLLVAEEAARRGHENHVAGIGDLYYDDGPRVRAAALELDLARQPFYRLGPATDGGLRDFDLVLMRKDPPVDGRYLAATFVLERAAAEVPVVNDPVALRTLGEKLFPLAFPELVPPTLMTDNRDRVAAFVARHGRAIVKPLSECSGRGIRLLTAERDLPPDIGGQFVVVQRFVDAVAEGDKRILLLDGGVLGAVNRIPQGPDALANIHQGARVAATEIARRDQEIIDAIAPALRRAGVWFAGIDVIGGWLIEVNITSPSAARQINAVMGTRIERSIVDFLERMAGGGPWRGADR